MPHTLMSAVQALFESIMLGLLSCVRDHNGRVQEAACSGLAELLEHAGKCTHGAVIIPRMQVMTSRCRLFDCCCDRQKVL